MFPTVPNLHEGLLLRVKFFWKLILVKNAGLVSSTKVFIESIELKEMGSSWILYLFLCQSPDFPVRSESALKLESSRFQNSFQCATTGSIFSISWQATALRFLGHWTKKSLILILKSKSCWSQWSECHYQSFLPTSKLCFPVTPGLINSNNFSMRTFQSMQNHFFKVFRMSITFTRIQTLQKCKTCLKCWFSKKNTFSCSFCRRGRT